MQSFHRARENRAAFWRFRKSYDVIKTLPFEFMDVFRAITADINADLVHGLDRFRADRDECGPGAFNLKASPASYRIFKRTRRSHNGRLDDSCYVAGRVSCRIEVYS